MKKTVNRNSSQLSGVDLFAGAGGFSLAASAVGIKIKAAVEMNPHACSTYKRNLIKGKHNPTALFPNDINEVHFEKLLKAAKLKKNDCDVLLGGPPCQGFSTHRINDQGIDDPRNSLLLRYFEFVREIRPKFFVVENVPGLLWKRHAKYLKKFLREAINENYIVHGPTVLNARDYGVPQNRKRIFIIGVRNDLNINFQWPPAATNFPPTSKEVLDGRMPAWITAKTVFDTPLEIGDINAVHMNHSEKIIEVFRRTPLNGGSRSDSGRILPCHEKHNGHRDVYGRIDPNRPSPTMTTACINPSKGRFVHPTEHHGITARHAARFQTFPENFVFDGGIIASGVQIGNAVPISLGKAVLFAVSSALNQYKNNAVKMQKTDRSSVK